MKKLGILLSDVSNPYWRQMVALYGELGVNYGFETDFCVPRIENDPAEQSGAFRTMLQKGYDAILINPATRDNLLPAILEADAQSSGTPLFDIGAKCDFTSSKRCKCYFPLAVADFETSGRMAAQALASGLSGTAADNAPDSKDPEGWAVIVGGYRNSRHSDALCRGAFEAFQAYFAQEHVITGYADYKREHARGFLHDFMVLFSEIRAIFCANDVMALGAAQAVEEFEPDTIPLVGGFDATPEGLEAVRTGRLYCTAGVSYEETVRGVYERLSGWFENGIFPSHMDLKTALFKRE